MLFFLLIQISFYGGWRDGSVANNIGSSARGSEFISQHPYDSSQLPIMPVPRDLALSHKHTCRKNTNVDKRKNNRSLKKFHFMCICVSGGICQIYVPKEARRGQDILLLKKGQLTVLKEIAGGGGRHGTLVESEILIFPNFYFFSIQNKFCTT